MAIFLPINGAMKTLVLLIIILFILFTGLKTKAHPATPAVYILGDSLVDVGNNNHLPLTIAKANFPHNGVDFPAGIPTGRFSNGRNSADFLAEKIGLPTSPPYLSVAGGATPITGVSFASGGAGILEETGRLLYKQSISLQQQVDYFTGVYDELVRHLGPSGAEIHLSRSLFGIVIGSNDLFAYFDPSSTVSKEYTPQEYVDRLVSTIKELLKTLHGLGARKLLVTGVVAIGCCPIQRRENRTSECNGKINHMSTKYNEGLNVMLQGLKSELSGMNYSYFDIYGAMENLFQNPQAYGFTEIKVACCGGGNLNADVPCIPLATYCQNRENHVFWDLYHPTEAVSSLFSDIFYNGSQEFMFPMNVKELLAI